MTLFQEKAPEEMVLVTDLVEPLLMVGLVEPLPLQAVELKLVALVRLLTGVGVMESVAPEFQQRQKQTTTF